jgi:hypothetical protein
MVEKMMEERKKYFDGGDGLENNYKVAQHVTHGEIDMPDMPYWRCLLENVVV